MSDEKDTLHGGGYGGWYCPSCRHPMGPSWGYGMGPEMMGPHMRVT